MTNGFDVRKFLESGGTKVATTPAEARSIFQKTEIGKAIIVSRSRGVSGRRGMRAPAPAPTFPSSLLGKTFSSASARATAEANLRDQQARERIVRSRAERRVRVERARRVRAGTIVGQIEARDIAPVPFVSSLDLRPSKEMKFDTRTFLRGGGTRVVEDRSFKTPNIRELFFGRAGEELVGISPIPFTKPIVTLKEISIFLKRGISPRAKEKIVDVGTKVSAFTPFGLLPRKTRRKVIRKGVSVLGFQEQVLGTVLPTTPGGVALAFATPFAFTKLVKVAPIVARIGGVGLGVSQVPTVLDPTIAPQERVVAGIGVGLGFGLAVKTPTKFQLGVKAQRSQLKILAETGRISPRAEEQLLTGIKLQKFLRGQPDVPIVKPVVSIIPKGTTIAEKEVFAKVLFAEDTTIFGGQALALRGLRKSADIDIIVSKDTSKVLRETQKLLEEVSFKRVTRGRGKFGGSVGLGGEKVFDIKSIEVAKEFPFTQKRVETLEGVKVIRISEQFSRALSGTLEFRKGGKDIGDVILSGRAIISQASIRLQEIRFPPLKAFRQFGLARAERRLLTLEQVVPEIKRVGRGKVIELGRPFEITTQFPTVQDILPKGKRARIGFDVRDIKLSSKDLGLPRIKVRGKPRDEFQPSDISRIKPSSFGPSKIKPFPTPSAFLPSVIKPKKERPSQFQLPPSSFEKAIAPPRFDFPRPVSPREPSGFGPSRIKFPKSLFPVIPISVVSPGFDFVEPFKEKRRPLQKRRTARGKKPKVIKKKRIGKPRRIAPSFTAIVLDIRGALPKPDPTFGITPAQIRKVPKRLKGKRFVNPGALLPTRLRKIRIRRK